MLSDAKVLKQQDKIVDHSMKWLFDITVQTLEERSRKEKVKEKRKAMLDARLAKVKQRKLQREGGTLGPDVHLSKYMYSNFLSIYR